MEGIGQMLEVFSMRVLAAVHVDESSHSLLGAIFSPGDNSGSRRQFHIRHLGNCPGLEASLFTHVNVA